MDTLALFHLADDAVPEMRGNMPSDLESQYACLMDLLTVRDGGATEREALQRIEHGLYAEQPPLPGSLAARGRPSREPESRQAVEQFQHLQWLVHAGYKRIAQDAAGNLGWLTPRRAAIEAFACALQSGWRLLTAHARTYTTLPAGFWADNLRLIAYAHEQGWWDRRAESCAAPVGILCQRLILLGLCQTNHLDAATLERLLRIVEVDAAQVAIRPPGGGAPQDAYAFQIGIDRPPRFMEQLDDSDVSCRLVDLEPVIAHNERRMQALQRDAHPSPLESQLRARLRQAWQSPPHRRHARRRPPRHEHIELVATLPACWQLLADAAGLPPMRQWPVANSPDAPPTASVRPETESLPSREAPFGTPSNADAGPPGLFTVADYSLSGVSLVGDAAPPGLQAGELVLLRRDGRPWQLGLVRWLTFPGGEAGVRCGVEIVGQKPEARLITAVAAHTAPVFEHAIQFRGGRRIAVEGRLFQPMRELIVADANSTRDCLAVRLLAQTTRHQVFELKHISPAAEATIEAGASA